jgi:hypothetical protein
MPRAAAIAGAHRHSGYDAPTSGEAIKAVLRGIRRRIVAVEAKAPATAPLIGAMLTARARSEMFFERLGLQTGPSNTAWH